MSTEIRVYVIVELRRSQTELDLINHQEKADGKFRRLHVIWSRFWWSLFYSSTLFSHFLGSTDEISITVINPRLILVNKVDFMLKLDVWKCFALNEPFFSNLRFTHTTGLSARTGLMSGLQYVQSSPHPSSDWQPLFPFLFLLFLLFLLPFPSSSFSAPLTTSLNSDRMWSSCTSFHFRWFDLRSWPEAELLWLWWRVASQASECPTASYRPESILNKLDPRPKVFVKILRNRTREFFCLFPELNLIKNSHTV